METTVEQQEKVTNVSPIGDIDELSAGQLKVLQNLIADDDFRKSFFEDPEAALAGAGLEVSEEDLAALKKIDQAAIDNFLSEVEERLSRTGLPVCTVLMP
ncbi:MAG: hypothetical protein H8D43_03625 [Chloroflexi bacterium]|nr:hypothetical protein [Chloroflexota bacterium]